MSVKLNRSSANETGLVKWPKVFIDTLHERCISVKQPFSEHGPSDCKREQPHSPKRGILSKFADEAEGKSVNR